MLRKNKEELEKYIAGKISEVSNLNSGSLVVIKAETGGVQKIKLAIIVALEFQKKSNGDIVFHFSGWECDTDREFFETADKLEKDQILILRLYNDYPISRLSFRLFLEKMRTNGNYVIIITDDFSHKMFEMSEFQWTEKNDKVLIDIHQFQEHLIAPDRFALPDCDKELLSTYWKKEEELRTLCFYHHGMPTLEKN